MSIRAFKQGELDRLCSLYALINAVRSTGFKLTRLQMQAVADDIIENLSSDDLKALMLGGAEHKDLMKLARRLNKGLNALFGKQVELTRPYKRNRPDLSTALREMTEARLNNAGVIVRISSGRFDHYSVFSHIEREKVRFIDSDHMPSLPLNELSTDGEKKYELHLENIYCLQIRKSELMHINSDFFIFSQNPAVF